MYSKYFFIIFVRDINIDMIHIEQVDNFIKGLENNILISDVLKNSVIKELNFFKKLCDKTEDKYKSWKNIPIEERHNIRAIANNYLDGLKSFYIFSDDWLSKLETMFILMIQKIKT